MEHTSILVDFSNLNLTSVESHYPKDCYWLIIGNKGNERDITSCSWDELPHYKSTAQESWIILKNGSLVIKLSEYDRTTLVSFHDHPLGVKILTLVDAVSFLKKGFAHIYKTYHYQRVSEMNLKDETFQQFILIKLLNCKLGLEHFFRECVREDQDTRYKIWICAASKDDNSSIFRQLSAQYYEMITKEKAVTHRRPYTTKEPKLFNLDGAQGKHLVKTLIKISKSDQKQMYMFQINRQNLFKLNWKGEGNGVVSFDPDNEKIYPRWEILGRNTLQRGFAATYNQFLNDFFRDLNVDELSYDRNFQAFVLLQLEIARRPDCTYEGESIQKNRLSRSEVDEGIHIAIRIDEKKYYGFMTQMFMGDRRRGYYQLLMSREDFENKLKRVEKDLEFW